MKQLAVLLLIVLGLVVLGGGAYLFFVDPEHDTTGEIDRTEIGEEEPHPDGPGSGSGGQQGGPRPSQKPTTSKSPRPLKPAPLTLEDISIPVRIQRGKETTVLRGCVLRPGGDALASAIVELIQVSQSSVLDPGKRTRVAEPVTTDAKGCFTFRGFTGGSGYLVRVEHGSYAPFELANIDAPAERETVLEDFRVAPGGTLLGTITQSGGVPIEGARVIAYARDGRVGLDSRLPVKQVLSDAKGDYVLQGLALGGYSLTVEATAMRSVFSPVIEVATAAAPKRLDFRLEPGKRVRGKVLTVENEPIEGAAVEARLRMGGGPIQARTLSDATGAFELEGLGPEELRLTASKRGFSSNSLIPVDPNQTTLHVLRLRENVGITGFVVAKKDQKPITSFGLMLWTIGKGDSLSEPIGGLRVVERSLDGSFTIEDVAPGEYRVQAFANDFSPTFTKTFPVKRNWVHSVNIELEEGAALVGRVVATDGEPIAGATVRMFENAYTRLPISKLLYGEFSELTKPVTTDDEGRFRFEHLAAGRVQLRASAAGRMPLVRRDVEVAGVGATDLGDLVLGLGGTVKGAVIHATGGFARGARVSLRSADGEMETTKTNNDGEFVFANVTPGEYTLSAEPVTTGTNSNFLTDAIASARSTKSVVVYEEQTTRIDVQLVRLQ